MKLLVPALDRERLLKFALMAFASMFVLCLSSTGSFAQPPVGTGKVGGAQNHGSSAPIQQTRTISTPKPGPNVGAASVSGTPATAKLQPMPASATTGAIKGGAGNAARPVPAAAGTGKGVVNNAVANNAKGASGGKAGAATGKTSSAGSHSASH